MSSRKRKASHNEDDLRATRTRTNYIQPLSGDVVHITGAEFTIGGLSPSETLVTNGSNDIVSYPYTPNATPSTIASRDGSGKCSVTTLGASKVESTGDLVLQADGGSGEPTLVGGARIVNSATSTFGWNVTSFGLEASQENYLLLPQSAGGTIMLTEGDQTINGNQTFTGTNAFNGTSNLNGANNLFGNNIFGNAPTSTSLFNYGLVSIGINSNLKVFGGMSIVFNGAHAVIKNADFTVTNIELMQGTITVDTSGGAHIMTLPTAAAIKTLFQLITGTAAAVNDTIKVYITTFGSASNGLTFNAGGAGGATLLTNQLVADLAMGGRTSRVYTVKITDVSGSPVYNFF